MLEGLTSIPWSKLKHAYGTAEDVPVAIQNLLDKKREVRKEAFENLSTSIIHQGTVYQATPYTIPFFYELLASAEVKNRENIINLLIQIALGSTTPYLLDGLDIHKFRKEVKLDILKIDYKDRLFYQEFGMSPENILACYNAVEKGASVFLELIQENDYLINSAAFYALAWFPEMARLSIPKIHRRLDLLSDEKSIAHAILALGILYRSTQQNFPIQDLHTYFEGSRLVRTSAAIASVHGNSPDFIIDHLTKGLKFFAEDHFIPDFYFHGGNLYGYLINVLAKYGAKHSKRVIPACCEALKLVDPYRSYSLTQEILNFITTNRDAPLKKAKASSLNALEVLALEHIANYGSWVIEGREYKEYAQMLKAAGLPDSQQKLREYLSSINSPSQSNDFLNRLASW